MDDADVHGSTRRELSLRRLRRIAVFALIGIVGVCALFLVARPALNAVKSWQSRRHAHKAFQFIAEEKWNEAGNEARASYQLRPSEPVAIRAVARFLTRVRQPQALEFWKLLSEKGPLTREDRRDQAAIALRLGETSTAEAALADLLGARDGGPKSPDWLLAAQLSTQKGTPEQTASYLEKIFASPTSSEREQLQAALLQLSTAPHSDSSATQAASTSAWARLTKIARGNSAAGLEALTILAQRELSAPPSTINHQPSIASAPAPMPNDELIHSLQTHPLSRTPQKLLTVDLQMHADPAQRDALIQRAIATWKDADSDALVALAKWLNNLGEFQLELETVPLERALQTRELFLQHLDALGALDRWSEIKLLLENQRFPIDIVIERMYLARCNVQLGEKVAADNNWRRALEGAGGDAQKLLSLADYAEKNGALPIAEEAYDIITRDNPRTRAAQQGRLRLAERSRDTKQIHAILAEMLKQWPNEAAIQNDEAYTRLLLLPNDVSPSSLAAIERLAEDLVKREPNSFPHRTLLALARLKQDHVADALKVYADLRIAPNAVSPSAVVVHAAILAANGDTENAKNEARQVKPDQILPEERALIESLL